MDTNWKETVTEDKVVQKAQTAQLSVCIIIYILLPQTTEQGYKFKKKKIASRLNYSVSLTKRDCFNLKKKKKRLYTVLINSNLSHLVCFHN